MNEEIDQLKARLAQAEAQILKLTSDAETRAKEMASKDAETKRELQKLESWIKNTR